MKLWIIRYLKFTVVALFCVLLGAIAFAPSIGVGFLCSYVSWWFAPLFIITVPYGIFFITGFSMSDKSDWIIDWLN